MSEYGVNSAVTGRRQSLHRKAIEMDGNGSEWEASDGEEPAGATQYSFDNYISSLEKSQRDRSQEAISVYSSEAEDDIDMDRNGGRKAISKYDASLKRKLPPGEKVSFDDSDDGKDVYSTFKNRKNVQRKKAAASTKRAKAVAKGTSMVGKREQPVLDVKKQRKRDFNYGAQEVSEDEDEELENRLPDYIKERRAEFERKIKKSGDHGLRLPPLYDDIYFPEDERSAPLETRPSFPACVIPTRAYEDIDLPFSSAMIPAPIAQYLRDYQIDGAAFMHENFVHQKGCILGDDMGLGKTIQVIAFLTAAFGKTADIRDASRCRRVRRLDDDRWHPRVLLIVPGSLIANWRSELDKWGWWNIAVYHGSSKEKSDALAMAGSGHIEIMITTYGTYLTSEGSINGIRWDCVICDEFHSAKNRHASITEKLLVVNALCRIGLTGTAVQNKYEELWTLLNWTNPGALGSIATWKISIAQPLKYGQAHGATNKAIAIARNTAVKLRTNLLPRFFIRRPKSLIAHELPKKIDRVVFCPFTEAQTEAYNTFCDSPAVQAMRDANNPCRCGSGKKEGWCHGKFVNAGTDSEEPWHKFMFPALHALRSICNHIALLMPISELPDKHANELERLQLAMPDTWKSLYKTRDSILHMANPDFCGKWIVLRKLLHFWHQNGDKVLVFSHSVRLLRMLRTLFSAKTDYNYSYLDGQTPNENRQTIVDDFNADENQFVFLISTRAGGVGLNITSANKVVVVDPTWNPAPDLQAQDRAYRLGQKRDVEVFRLVSAGTVEEIVYARQIYKQQQASIAYDASVERRYFRGVQDQREMKGEIFGLANIFAPQSDNVVLKDIVNKTNIAESRAGVEIAGLDFENNLSDDDDADAENPFKNMNPDAAEEKAVDMLAQSIIGEVSQSGPGGKKGQGKGNHEPVMKKKDPIQAILASVGVEYTHNNAEVIGTSKMETRISSRAQRAEGDLEYERKSAFAKSEFRRDGLKGDGMGGDADPADEEDEEGFGGSTGGNATGGEKYRFRPEEGVRRRQFCSMARAFGFEDVVEFGLVVEGWTQAQRRDALERWYGERRRKLKEEDEESEEL